MAEDWDTHAQQQYVRLNDAKNPHILFVPHKRPWNKYYFLLKNMAPGLPRFYVISTWKGYCKNLFSTLWCLSKNLIDSIICAITVERFQIVTHITTFFTSRTKQIYAKTLTVFESTFKIKPTSARELFEILLASVVTCKKRFLYENEIVQYLQNYNYQDVNRNHFRKP